MRFEVGLFLKKRPTEPLRDAVDDAAPDLLAGQFALAD
jgi:hypothetical protein